MRSIVLFITSIEPSITSWSSVKNKTTFALPFAGRVVGGIGYLQNVKVNVKMNVKMNAKVNVKVKAA